MPAKTVRVRGLGDARPLVGQSRLRRDAGWQGLLQAVLVKSGVAPERGNVWQTHPGDFD